MPVDSNGEPNCRTKRRHSDLAASKSVLGSGVKKFQKEKTERAFRGFEKLPTVVLPRHDFTPLLKTMNTIQKTQPLKQSPVDFASTKIDERFFNCQVKMFRDDLQKMREAIAIPSKQHTCQICSKKYPDIKKLRNHHDNKHLIVYGPLKPPKRVSFSDKVIVHEIREYHECRKCTKIFETYNILKQHMKENHKKRKCYICHYCAKKFVDRSIFKVHIKLHCDICGDLSPTKLKYNEHRRYVCKVYKLHTCTNCDAAFYSLMDLKDHSYDHMEDIYVCDVCKDQFGTKCALTHHIKFLHSESRPVSLYTMRLLGSDRLYLCNFCNESSVEKTLIETHINLLPDLSNKAMTGYKDYYFCDQCMKKFDTENEMLQHKWSHFLKEKQDSEEKTIPDVEKAGSDSNEYQTPDSTVDVLETTIKFDPTKNIPNMLPKVVLKRLSTEIIEKTTGNGTSTPIPDYSKSTEVKNNNKELDTATQKEKELEIATQKEKELVVATQKENEQEIATQEEKELQIATQKEKELEIATQKEKELQIATQKEKELVIVPRAQLEAAISMNGEVVPSKKPIVVGHKTLLSRHQCEICNKYLSSAFTLRRHVETTHRDFDNLQCRDCEERFVWPSLLLSHNCLRNPLNEGPFEDARPEILFDNIPRISNDSYESCIDFEIPKPLCELGPQSNGMNSQSGVNRQSVVNANGLTAEKLTQFVATHAMGYKIVVQEVPIEF